MKKMAIIIVLCFWGCVLSLNAQTRIDTLVVQYEQAKGRQQTDVANEIFRILDKDEVTDSLMQFTASVNKDTLGALLYYYVGEQKYFNQEFSDAITYFNKALPLIGEKNLGLLNDCYNELAICHTRRGSFSLALDAASRCVEIGERLNDKERLVTSTNIIGCIYVMAKQSADGEKHLQRSLKLAQELNDSVKISVRYGTLSELYHTMGNDLKAVEYAHEALRLDSLRQDWAHMAIRQVQLASPLYALGKIEEVEQLLLKARPVLEESHNMVSLAICLNQLGYVALKKEHWNEAKECFEKVINIYSVTGERFGESKAQWGLWLSLKHSDIRQAASHLEAYAILKDTLYKQDVAKMTAGYEARYQNNELKLLNAQEKQYNTMLRWIGGVIILALVASVVFLLFILHLKTKNTRMKKQLSQVRDQLLTPADKEFIRRVDQLLAKQFQNYKVDLEQLASELFITRQQLNRKMRSLLDESMQEHVNNVRIKRAKELIKNGDMNISEVARACGIDDIAYFSRFFKKMTGVAPRDYKSTLES